MSDLPPGFVLDQAPSASGLPSGFVIDKPGALTDIVKSLPADALAAGAGTFGSMGDIEQLGNKLYDKLPSSIAPIAGAIGHAVLSQINPLSNVSGLTPTSSGIEGAVQKITGPLYQPQTTPGKVTKTIAEFAPLVIGGGESLLAEFLIRAVLPGVASELAGEATQGTSAEPYARVAAAVAGGLPGLLRGGAKLPAAPAAADLKAAAQAGYRAPEVAAVQIKPQAVTNLAADIENSLLKDGFRPTAKSAGDTFGEIRSLRVPQAVQSVSIDDLDTARKALGKLAKEVDTIGQLTTEAAAARSAISKIDDFLPNLQQSDLLAGDAAQANQILKDARANYRAYKGVSLVDTKQANAELQAASTYGGGNINNATRQAFRPLLKNNAAGAQGLGQAAIPQLEQVVKGGMAGNVARQIGRLAPSGPVNMGIHLGAALGTGGATIPVAIGAHIAKKIGEGITRSEVDKLRSIVSRNSPLYRSTAPQALLPPPSAIAKLSPAVRQALIGMIIASRQALPQQP